MPPLNEVSECCIIRVRFGGGPDLSPSRSWNQSLSGAAHPKIRRGSYVFISASGAPIQHCYTFTTIMTSLDSRSPPAIDTGFDTPASTVISSPVEEKLDIEHVLVEDDPRMWSLTRKVPQFSCKARRFLMPFVVSYCCCNLLRVHDRRLGCQYIQP